MKHTRACVDKSSKLIAVDIQTTNGRRLAGFGHHLALETHKLRKFSASLAHAPRIYKQLPPAGLAAFLCKIAIKNHHATPHWSQNALSKLCVCVCVSLCDSLDRFIVLQLIMLND